METVPVTRRVHRTRRVAVALVAGHALLGALIGWLTFGLAGPGARAGAHGADQLGARPPGTVSPDRHPPRDVTMTGRRDGGPVWRAVAPRATRGTPAPAVTTPGILAGGPGAVPDPSLPPSRSPLPAAPAPSASAAVPVSPAPPAPASLSPLPPSPTAPESSAPASSAAPCRPEGTFGHAEDGCR